MTCLLCEDSARLKHKLYPGYQQPGTFEIYHCPNCDTAFASPRVETSHIYETIYKNGKIVPGYDRYWKYGENIKNFDNPLEYLSENEDIYWGVKEALSLLVKDRTSTKILEIGSGLGYLTYALNISNYSTTGIDISQTAVNQAIDTFGDHYICADVFDYAKLYPGSFDIVILTEVIEHIDEPIEFLETINKLLKPQGHAVITTPNKSFYNNEIIWVSDLPPVHWWWLSETSIEYIAKKVGMTLSFIDFSKYFKKNYRAIDMNMMLNGPLPSPIFNMNGDLIVQIGRKEFFLSSHIRLLASKIPLIRNFYRRLREFRNRNFVVCGKRGFVLCAVLQKA